ncbi:MAG: dTMP kinase, partial [Rhodospirillales bacterium]|nr:dTMP kinase [Rhodospirillales bacterium]
MHPAERDSQVIQHSSSPTRCAGEGIFITVDGPNGSGKTTIAETLAKTLELRRHEVFLTKQPSDLPIGRLLRTAQETCSGRVLAYLVAADRFDHIEQEIAPQLGCGRIVISARYVESSLALQALDGLTKDRIWQLNSEVPIPNLSVVLRANPEV